MGNIFIGKALIDGKRKTVTLEKSTEKNIYMLGETPYFQKAADVVCSTSGDVIFGQVCSNIDDIAEFCRNNLSSEQIAEFGEALHTRTLVGGVQSQPVSIMRVPNPFYKKQPNKKR